MNITETIDIILEATGGHPFYNPYTAYSEADRVKFASLLQEHFPYVNVNRSTLGGEDRASLLATISLDKKEKWNNGILENSRYAKFHLSDRKLECIAGGRFAKTRRSVVRDVQHAADKIIAWSAVALQSIGEAAQTWKPGDKSLQESDFPGLGLAAGIASGISQVKDTIKHQLKTKLGYVSKADKEKEAASEKKFKDSVENEKKAKEKQDKRIASHGGPEGYRKHLDTLAKDRNERLKNNGGKYDWQVKADEKRKKEKHPDGINRDSNGKFT
jgi:hypothetical protein